MNFLAALMLLDKIMAEIKSFVRQDMIVQADGDSGDSAQRTATLYAMTSVLESPKLERRFNWIGLNYERSMNAITVAPGVYRRSTDASHWGHNPNNFSRDQFSILQLAFAMNGDRFRLKQAMDGLISRKLLHQNVHPGTDAPPEFRKFPDVAHPSHFSVHIRGMGYWFLYPVLVAIDCLLLADLVVRAVHDPANDLDNMLSQHILYAALRYPTPASWLARHLYALTNWKEKLRAYHGPARNGIPPLAELIILAYNIFES